MRHHNVFQKHQEMKEIDRAATMQQKLRQYTENYATATFCSHNQGENERAKTDDVICWGKNPTLDILVMPNKSEQ